MPWLVPEDFQPSWDYWEKVPSGSINDLASIAVDLEPRKDIYSILRDANEELEVVRSRQDFLECEQKYDQVEQITQMLNEIEKREKEIRELIILHISDGFLHGECDDNGNIVKIKLSNFIEWLKATEIPYPEQLKNRLRMREKLEVPRELTAGEKSKLSQENTTLRRLFNQMVALHYDSGVSAYTIEKDLTADVKTINKYLDFSK